LFDGVEAFDTPKPVELLRRMLQISTTPRDNDVVVDFFAGAALLAEAVLDQNVDDSGHRSVILVQIAGHATTIAGPTKLAIRPLLTLERSAFAGLEPTSEPRLD
jgi:DNA methylase